MAGLFSAERLGLDIPSKQESCTWPSHWIPVPVHAPIPYSKDRVSFINIIQLLFNLNFGDGVLAIRNSDNNARNTEDFSETFWKQNEKIIRSI